MSFSRIKHLIVTGIIGAVLALGASSAASPSTAAAGDFCMDVLLQAGGTNSMSNTCIHGASHRIAQVTAYATSNAMACAGGTYHSYTPDWVGGAECCNSDQCTAFWTPNGAQAYPALHNHSTHQGRFRGYFSIY